MCELKTQNLFLDLLYEQLQNVEIFEPPHGIQSQSKSPFVNKTITILPHDGIWIQRHPLGIRKHQYACAEHRLKTLKEARNEASAAHELARQQMAE